MRNNVEEDEDILERKQGNDCNSCRVTENMRRRKREHENKEELSKKDGGINNKKRHVNVKKWTRRKERIKKKGEK